MFSYMSLNPQDKSYLQPVSYSRFACLEHTIEDESGCRRSAHEVVMTYQEWEDYDGDCVLVCIG